MIKMQHALAARWLGNVPPLLSRMFLAPAAATPGLEADKAETAAPNSRWTWEESNEENTGRSNQRFTRRPEILVPVDFSAGSEEAVEYAIKVARRAQARLILLHAVHLNLTPYGPANPTWLRSALCREALQKMEGILARAQRQGVPAISVVEEGAPARVIVSAATRWKVDLLVVCSRKRNKWARFFGQKVMENVTRAVECPIMAIHLDLKGAAA